jgi:dTDP-4-dehydrorhamnose 3,5-epimerase
VKVLETAIPDVLIVEPEIFGDSRGFFMKTHQVDRHAAAGISRTFVQDNLSRSGCGVRGLHLQNPDSQGKLVTVLARRVLDVAVDVRHGSPSFSLRCPCCLRKATALSTIKQVLGMPRQVESSSGWQVQNP